MKHFKMLFLDPLCLIFQMDQVEADKIFNLRSDDDLKFYSSFISSIIQNRSPSNLGKKRRRLCKHYQHFLKDIYSEWFR